MEIKVKIDAEGLESAIHTLAQVLGNFEYPVNLPKGQEDEAPKEEPKVEKTPEPEKQAASKPEPESRPEAKQKVTLETVRGKLADLAREGKQDKVKELITSFDSQKLSEVPEEKYEDLLAKAEEL